jgi:hypothetical protein
VSRALPVVASIALVVGVIGVSPAAIQPSQAAGWGFIRLENVLSADDLRIAHPGAVAYDAKSKHTFTLDANAGVLVESDRNGIVVSRRNVAGLKLQGVAGMAIRPTVDTTDAAAATSLYLSVANASDGGAATGPAILELALAEPVVAEALAGIPDNVGHKVKEIDTTGPTWDPFSPDPSGIAYARSTGKLVVADGEIEEENVNNYPYPGINVWNADPVTGAGDGILDTTAGSPINKEPVGVAWDPLLDELYISRDGSNSAVWAYTRSGNTWVLRSSRLVTAFGVADAEGLAFGNGQLYIGDGTNKEIWVIGPGPDGKVATSDDVLVSHFDTLAAGITDPEGVGIDHNTGNVWVLSHKDGEGMVEFLPNGTVVSTTHFDFPTDNPGGLDIAPTSSTTDAPSVMSAWIAQRGVDNNSDPDEKDGKIFEVSIAAAPPPPPPGGNLLVNGDFESGSLGAAPPGWSANANFTKSGAAQHGGSFSGRHLSAADAGYKIEQTVAATAGETYHVAAWANPIVTADAFTVNFKIQFRTNTKAISTVVIGKVTKRTVAGWDDYSTSLVAPAGTTKARVFMVVSSLKTTVYVDDISLTQQP